MSEGEKKTVVKQGWQGRFYEDFEVGDIYRSPLGRTVTACVDELLVRLEKTGIPHGRVNTLRELVKDPHVMMCNVIQETTYLDNRRLSIPAAPIRFEGRTSSIRRLPP